MMDKLCQPWHFPWSIRGGRDKSEESLWTGMLTWNFCFRIPVGVEWLKASKEVAYIRWRKCICSNSFSREYQNGLCHHNNSVEKKKRDREKRKTENNSIKATKSEQCAALGERKKAILNLDFIWWWCNGDGSFFAPSRRRKQISRRSWYQFELRLLPVAKLQWRIFCSVRSSVRGIFKCT